MASRAYLYDAAGNITQIDGDIGRTQYGYDQIDRLTQASPDQALQVRGLPTEQYNYDPVGNRTSSAHQPGAWTYNQDNQLTRYPRTTPFSAAAPIDTQVSYTPQGHTQKETSGEGAKSYTYNAAERLIKYANTLKDQASPSVEASYRYDPFGRRISKSVSEGTSTKIIYFQFSDAGLMAEADEDGKLQRAYGFNPTATQQGLWSTDPIWQANVSNGSLTDTNTGYHYIHTDHLGTPIVATGKDGSITWKAVTEAFGATGALPESVIQINLRFPGQYFDSETETHYNFNRDYRSNLGRYIQSDPIGLRGGQNLFAYVGGNPLGLTDPTGLAAPALLVPVVIQVCRKALMETLAAMTGVGAAAVIVEVVDCSQNECKTDDDKPDCRKASPWDLLQAGITDPHAYKTENGAVPWSRYDICKCKDGSIRIAAVGQCGTTRNFLW